MGCTYFVGSLSLPLDSRERVTGLLNEFDIGDDVFFEFHEGEFKGKKYLSLEQTRPDMSFSEASSIDDFLDKVAEVIDGTEQDGQLLQYDHDEGRGHHILVKGKRFESSGGIVRNNVPDVRIGEKYTALVEVEVIGIAEGQVIVIG